MLWVMLSLRRLVQPLSHTSRETLSELRDLTGSKMDTVVLTLFDNALSFYLARVLRSGHDIRPGLPGLVTSPVERAGPFALMHLLLLLLLLLL